MSEERPKIYPGTPETAREQALRQWWAEQELKSPANLEAAARQIITLVTSLLGLLLAILAVAEDPLPAYLASSGLRLAGGLAILALLGALWAALIAVWPRRYAAAPDLPQQQAAEFQKIIRFKSQAVMAALILFGLGLLLLAMVLLLALLLA